jgi:hypothetical protein
MTPKNSEVDGGDELEAAGKQRTPFDPGHADGAILERWRSASSAGRPNSDQLLEEEDAAMRECSGMVA